MKHTYAFLFFFCLFAGNTLFAKADNNLPQKEDVLNAIYLANTYWQEENPSHGRAFWDRAAYHTGNMAVYEITKDPAFLEYSIAFAEHNNWKGATSDNKQDWKYGYGETMDYVLFGDWQTCFQVYADLYNIEPADHKIARAREVMEYQMSTAFDGYWWWVDALYMVMPVMTRLYKITENPLYLEKLHEYWQYTNSIMYDEEEGIYYRDANYVYPQWTTNSGKKDFWSRGNGWAIAALARVLTDLPENDPYRDTYIGYYTKMAEKLKEVQQAEGHWTRSLLDPEYVPGYETSGTAFFTFGLLWGLNNGYLLEENYGDAARKGWNYLSSIALQESGRVGYVQPIGGDASPGNLINSNSTADFGVGAFLLAAVEMYKYVGGEEVTVPLLRLSSMQLLDATRIQFVFNDVLNAASARNINNYTMNGQPIDGVVNFDGERTVTVMLSETLDYGKYTFSVKDIISRSGAAVSGSTTRDFLLSVPLTACEAGITPTASSGAYGNKPSNTIDNKFSSRWSCQEKQEWIKYDLGELREVYAVDIAFYQGTARLSYFDLELSADDVIYTPVLTNGTSSGLSNELERFSFSPQNAQYVRIVCKGNSVDESGSFTEVRIRYSDSEALNNITLPARIHTDIILPSGVLWSSSNASVLSPAGVVVLPAEDTPVTLTARAGLQTKDFAVIVSARNIMKNNTVLHYAFEESDKFAENEKTYLKDKSTNQNHAQIYGNAQINGTLDLTQNTGAGFSSNGYLMAPDNLLNNLRSYSVLLKVNPARLDNLPRAYDFGSGSSNSTFGRLDALSIGLKYNGETTHYINSSTSIQTDKDTYLAFTFDAGSKQAKIYIDGEIAAEGTFSLEPYQLSLIGADTRNYIGRTQWWDTNVAWSNVDFCGTMDDFYMFDIALTKNEIIQLQQSGNTTLKTFTHDSPLIMYPNPANPGEPIYIKDRNDQAENSLIEISNMQGMVIASKSAGSLPASFSIGQSGIYLVKVSNAFCGIKTFKLIVK